MLSNWLNIWGGQSTVIYDLNLMASEFGVLYQAKNDRMNEYLDVLNFQGKLYQSIVFILKPRNDVSHADVLTYLVAAIEGDSPRQISIDNKEAPSIDLKKTNLSRTFISTWEFFVELYKQSFSVHQVVTRKRRM